MARNFEIRIKLSENELNRIKGKAEVMALPISSFMRFVACESSIEVVTNKIPIKYIKVRK